MLQCKPMMGTFIEIQIDFDQEKRRSHQNHIIAAAFREIARVEYLMTAFENHSDISVINQTVNTSKNPRIEIHPWTYEVLQLAKKIYEMTKGAFDCGVGHILGKWGIRSQMQEFDDLLSNYSIANIEFEENYSVRIHKPVLLDLAGIAKGYAVDKAIQVLKDFGVKKGIVNAGGDLRVLGKVPKKILIRQLGVNTRFLDIGGISNLAIASSSSMIRDESNLVQSKHLINPHQKMPIIGEKVFTVTAESCAVADALTKALAVDQDIHAPYFALLGAKGHIVQTEPIPI